MPRSGRPPAPRGSAAGDLSRIGVSSRRERGFRTGAPYLVPAALALAAAVAAWLSWGRLASLGASLGTPETQIRQALAAQERAHLDDVYGFHAGGTVELYGTRYEDVVPLVEGGRATVVAMLTAQGRVAWRGEAAQLAYVGRERFHMRPCTIARWCGEGDQFDRLRGVLLLLFRRHDAAERADLDAYGRLLAPDYRDGGEDRAAALARLAGELAAGPGRTRVSAWQIRVERDRAEVGEDREVSAPGAPPRQERRVYRLAREGERWLLVGGV
ncbi:nuclear transport factor 2 family protein [Anaeromyxobacter diazotrophicus]|uniref:Uncharacterized protein n=1 Tax=Anaeromyxobacter diazotrophicus TaxID=2590199 RepID=A0A7I9VIN6_9BACT|nr:nuclear transport factor 2 family protein [Anaeromyxobacter diazotrophicus]GEJ55887.1 hypothetical protein AMYX_06280 [Anaeromyxobacter diazotrophicus]